MNTWFTDIVRTGNERLMSEDELARVFEYYGTVPARLKLGDELQRLEAGLTATLHTELARRYPERSLYSPPLVSDLVESLRHVNLAVLADEPRLLRERWTSHLLRLIEALGVEPGAVHDAYLTLGELLGRQLTRSAWELLRPVYDELLEALTVAQSCARCHRTRVEEFA